VITALSFGIPVIVPAVGCLPEVALPPAGIVYDPEDADGLRKAMLEIQERDISSMSEAACQRAHDLDWAQIAERTRQAYAYEKNGHR
jgi:glycosyltransferase involved in cell wall biosynthesis